MTYKVKIIHEVEYQQIQTEQMKNVMQLLVNDAQYKILLNKQKYAVKKIDTKQSKATKKKINENKTQVTVNIIAEIIKQPTMLEEDLINQLLRYNNKKDEIKSRPISVEVIEVE